ncbi:hypothetical protein HDU78_009754 [Chytriomyces hyalinus]|nr:hypothetical protein HDU78_009754 [Chytriomyces hyalinus]
MRSCHTLLSAAPRRSERLRQRRLAKELQLSESTTAVAGSKRSHVDEDTGVRFTLKRIRLIVKEEATVEATVEAPELVLEETVVLPIPMDTAESENFSADMMDMDPHPLPVFSQLVYRPSQLSMSVAMDEILIPSCTSSPGRNSSRTVPSLDKRHLTRSCGIWRSEHLRQLRRYGQREAQRILDLRIEAEQDTLEAEEAALKDCLFADMGED